MCEKLVFANLDVGGLPIRLFSSNWHSLHDLLTWKFTCLSILNEFLIRKKKAVWQQKVIFVSKSQ